MIERVFKLNFLSKEIKGMEENFSRNSFCSEQMHQTLIYRKNIHVEMEELKLELFEEFPLRKHWSGFEKF